MRGTAGARCGWQRVRRLPLLAAPAARTAAAGAATAGPGGGGGPPFVLGVDPDLNGAVAVVGDPAWWGPDPRADGAVRCSSARLYDLPTFREPVGKVMRRRHDPAALLRLLDELRLPAGCPAFLEKPRNFPTDGKHSWYGSGYGFGVWWTALQARGLDVRVVGPAAWKKDVGLYGRAFTKDDSRARALLLYPTLEAELRRKKDHGRAEALLIAAWGLGYRGSDDDGAAAAPEEPAAAASEG